MQTRHASAWHALLQEGLSGEDGHAHQVVHHADALRKCKEREQDDNFANGQLSCGIKAAWPPLYWIRCLYNKTRVIPLPHAPCLQHT